MPRGAATVGAERLELATEVDPAEEEPECCHLMIQFGFHLQTMLMCPSLPQVLHVPEKPHSEARCDFPHLKQIKSCPRTGRMKKIEHKIEPLIAWIWKAAEKVGFP